MGKARHHNRLKLQTLKLCLTILLGVLFIDGSAQVEMLGEVTRNYLTTSGKLLAYQEVVIDWKMEGVIQVHLNEGINNLIEENPTMAEENFSQVIKHDSTIWQAFYYRAICRKQLQQLRQARKDILTSLKLQSQSYEAIVESGKIEQLLNNPADADKAFNKAIRMSPDKVMAHYLKGNLKQNQNQMKEAISLFKKCLLKDSSFHDARIKLAILEIFTTKKPESGLPHFEKVLQYDSLNRDALLLRSLLIFKTDRNQCLRDLEKLARTSPNNIMVLYLRGLVLSELEIYNRAFNDFHKVIEATYESENQFVGKQTWMDKRIDIQNAGAYTVSRVYGLPAEDAARIKKAYCLILLGSYDQSIVTIDSTSLGHNEPLCLYLKGVASEHKGSHHDALRYYNLALRLDNDILDAHKKRGIYAQELKEWNKSILDFSDALRINPEVYVIYKIRGVSFYHVNDFPRAIDDFTRYLQRDSLNKEVIGYRGIAYLRMGNVLDGSVDITSSNVPEAFNYKKAARGIDSLLLLKDTVKVLHYLEKLTKKAPAFSEGYVVKIKLLVNNDEWKRIEKEVPIAIRNFRADVNRKDLAYLLTIIGVSCSKDKKYDQAIDHLSEAIKFDKMNSQAFLERGKILMAMNKASKGMADLKKATSLGSQEASELLANLGNR